MQLTGLRAMEMREVPMPRVEQPTDVLVRMRRGDPRRPQWLLIKHRDEYADEGSDVVAEHMTSAVTGRTMEEIAAGRKAARAESRLSSRAERGIFFHGSVTR